MIIEVVSLKGCFWCTRVVELIEGEGLRIHSYKILDKSRPESYESDLAGVRQKLGSPPGKKISFPLVWIDGTFVGGFAETERELLSRKLRI
jgi:glutaredoxin